MSTFVPINDLCNLHCSFCGIRRSSPASDEAVQGWLSDVEGQRVTFGGGEPTIDERLGDMAALASEGGASGVVVETNGVRAADPEFARQLVAQGVTQVRLMLLGPEPETYERVAGSPEACALAWQGGSELLNAGAELSVVVPICQENVEELDGLLDGIAERLEGVSSVTLRPVYFSVPRHEGPHADDIRARAAREMVPLERLAPALASAVERAERLDLEVHVDAADGLPLCALRDALSALDRVRPPREGRADRRAECLDCAMIERCGGQGPMDEALFGPATLYPFDRLPPALIRNTTFEPVFLRSPGLPAPGFGFGDKVEIRIVMPCNQDCTFCFVNREAPSPDLETLETGLDQAIQSGAQAIVFTGGEPTLSRHLTGLIRRATEAGVPCRGIQTNALRLADGALADELIEAGLNHAHVSLHAADPGRYRAITGFGEPTDAARGARRLVEAGVDVSMSLVICQANADHIEPTLRFIREEVGPVRVVLSIAREQLGVPRPWDRTLVRYTEAAHAVVEALEVGPRIGLVMDSAGTCSMPPCVLPPEAIERHAEVLLVGHRVMTWEGEPERSEDTGEDHSVSNEFVEACESCTLRSRCPGIQRTYLERRGAGEFRAVRPE